jgi:regulator of replication initiation timing
MENFNSAAILLELYRYFSDKEKLNWIISDYKKLERKFKNVVSENNSLKIRNAKLKQQIKDEEIHLASSLKGQKTVTVKAYMKLLRRCQMFEERVWELVKERNDKIEIEKL